MWLRDCVTHKACATTSWFDKLTMRSTGEPDSEDLMVSLSNHEVRVMEARGE